MPIAALPSYRGRDFRDAAPAMRFGMYLPIWTERADQEAEIKERASKKSREAEDLRAHLDRHGMDATIVAWTRRDRNPVPGLWAKNDHAAREAWRQVAWLSRRDRELMGELLGRQVHQASVHVAVGGLLRLDARAIAPFTTGLGNEHPLENGFAFLNPYGLPYLPGSGVKGVLRQAARELASGEWGDTKGWRQDPQYLLQSHGKPVLDSKKQPVLLSMIDVIFGRETPSGESEHVRGALAFWDVIPQVEGDSLMVEIMTPHQGHYYQWRKDQSGNAIEVSPHESGQPNPISFLTVPPGSRFVFHVQCDIVHLGRLAPDLVTDRRWQTLLDAAFRHAFDWLGFGAKTAVGYGQMRHAGDAPSGDHPGESGGPAGRGPSPRESTRWVDVVLKLNPGSGELTVSHGGKLAVAAGAAASRLRDGLPPEMAERLRKKKELRLSAVTVECEGNLCTIADLIPNP